VTARTPARVYLLSAGAFAVGTSAYVVSGMLSAVATELGVSVTAAGQLTTAFALAYALGAPLLAVLAGRWERRTLLVVALLAAGAGNALAALAPNYPLLLLARVVAALGAAAFTPAATLVATQLSPPERRGRAVAAVFSGLTLALVVGVPAGSLLEGPLGFRGVFALVAATCVVAAVGVRLLVPRVEAPPAVGLRARLAVAADRRVLTVLGVSVLALLAVMTVYTYIAPLLAELAQIGGGQLGGGVLGLLLLGYGLGCLLGNSLGGRLADRFGSRRPLLAILPLFVALLATLPLTAGTVPGAAAALFALGAVGWTGNAPIQSWLIELAPQSGGLVLSLNASAIYLGAGLSGVVGGAVIAWLGVRALPLVAALIGVCSVLMLLLAARHRRAPVTAPLSTS
jgi:predicted MFS family arabinose efflux permease